MDVVQAYIPLYRPLPDPAFFHQLSLVRCMEADIKGASYKSTFYHMEVSLPYLHSGIDPVIKKTTWSPMLPKL